MATEFWTSGKKGSLSPWSQAKVWALATLGEEYKLGLSHADISRKVWTVGRPRKHPSKQAIRKLHVQFRNDGGWFPEKLSEAVEKRGPKRKFTPQKQLAVKRAMETAKQAGIDPSVPLALQRCPTATVNAETNMPFDKKLILNVMKTQCNDFDAHEIWGRLIPVSKTALSRHEIVALGLGQEAERDNPDTAMVLQALRLV